MDRKTIGTLPAFPSANVVDAFLDGVLAEELVDEDGVVLDQMPCRPFRVSLDTPPFVAMFPAAMSVFMIILLGIPVLSLIWFVWAMRSSAMRNADPATV